MGTIHFIDTICNIVVAQYGSAVCREKWKKMGMQTCCLTQQPYHSELQSSLHFQSVICQQQQLSCSMVVILTLISGRTAQ